MKLLAMLVCSAALLPAVRLQDIKTVYLFPMRNGFDQYLADRLAADHVFQVVLDPKAADAIFTDSLGPHFEQAFDQRVLDVKTKDSAETRQTTFGVERGTLFLVSKSKQIVWSFYQPPKDGTAKQLEKAARRSVAGLKKDFAPPAPPAGT